MGVPKPICFMVTPFGVKKTGLAPGAPAEVDFDRLWVKLFEPLIDRLGYEPVRADVDLWSVDHHGHDRAAGPLGPRDRRRHPPKCERLLRGRGPARRARDRLRPCRSELGEAALRRPVDAPRAVRPGRRAHHRRGSPGQHGEARATRRQARRVEDALLRDARVSQTADRARAGVPCLAERHQRRERQGDGRAARDQSPPPEREGENPHRGAGRPVQLHFVVVYELLKLVRDCVGWRDAVQFVDRLPEKMQSSPLFVEQRALAVSKSGEHLEAIGALQELIKLSGETPEREGLLGGRFKKLWRERRGTSVREAARFLDQAIDHYERGRRLDLNEYYAASNLPLLLRSRNAAGDSDRAARIATCVVAACERAIELKTGDEWVYPTLFGAALHAGDLAKARSLVTEVRRQPEVWKLETSLDDFRDAVRLLPDQGIRTQLETIVAEIAEPEPSVLGSSFAHS